MDYDGDNNVRFHIVYWRYRDLWVTAACLLALWFIWTLPNHAYGGGDWLVTMPVLWVWWYHASYRIRVWYWMWQGCLVDVLEWNTWTKTAVIDLRKRKDKEK